MSGVGRVAVAALTLATAAIHVSRALADPEIGPLFGLNAAGYVVLVALLLAPWAPLARWRRAARIALGAYAALTIALWGVWVGMSGDVTALGIVDKVIELALIVLLWRGGGPRQEDGAAGRAAGTTS